MLSDEIIDKVNERLIRRIEQGNEYILNVIGENIKKIKSVGPNDAQKLANILKYGGDYEKIVKKLSKITKLNVKDIYEIFENVAKHDYRFAKQFYNYRKMKYIPYYQNTTLQKQVNAIARMTANEYLNITKTTALGLGIVDKDHNITYKALKKAYSDLIDEAVINISQGKETFDTAMKRQLKQLGYGLKVIYPTTYIDKNGVLKHHTKRLDSALRQQMNDGLRKLHNEIQQDIGKTFDSDGVEITVHQYPAVDHQYVQGRQFSNKEYDKLQTKGVAKDYTGKVINIHAIHKDGTLAISHRPISQYNCYHYTFAIILGVNEPQYSDKKLQKMIDDNNEGFMYEGKHYTMYQGTQLQRQLETSIRDNKNTQILARASDNKDLIQQTQSNITILNNKYKKLCSASGLPSKENRLKVSGYHRVKVN